MVFRKHLQFHLASMIQFVMLCGSLVVVFTQNQPWIEVLVIATSGGVECVASSSDSTIFASASNNGDAKVGEDTASVTIYNFNSEKPLWLRSQKEEVYSICFSHDDALLATASKDGIVRLWNWRTGVLFQQFQHPEPVHCVKFSPDGLNILTACDDGILRIWNLNGLISREIKGFQGYVRNVSYSKKGTRIAASNAKDRTLRILNVADGKEVMRFNSADRLPPRGTCFIGDDIVITSVADELLNISIPSTNIVWRAPMFFSNAVRVSPECDRILSSETDRAAKVIDASDGKILAILRRHGLSRSPVDFDGDSEGIYDAVFAQNGRIVAAEGDGKLIIWERRFPEWWWGHFYRPEVWLAIIFGALWLWKVATWLKREFALPDCTT